MLAGTPPNVARCEPKQTSIKCRYTLIKNLSMSPTCLPWTAQFMKVKKLRAPAQFMLAPWYGDVGLPIRSFQYRPGWCEQWRRSCTDILNQLLPILHPICFKDLNFSSYTLVLVTYLELGIGTFIFIYSLDVWMWVYGSPNDVNKPAFVRLDSNLKLYSLIL